MASPNRFALRDAGEATFYDLETGKAIVTLDTIKTASMEFTGETTYARGGYGNPRIVGFDSNREGTLSLEDALFDKDAISMLTGNQISEGTKEIKYKETLEVTSNEVTLSKTVVGALEGVYEVNADGTNGKEFTLGDPTTNDDEYSIDTGTITLSSNVNNGTNVRVYYVAETSEDAKTVRVSSDAFGGTFRVIVDLLVKDTKDNKLYAAQVEIPRGKFENEFTFDLSVDGDPSTLNLPVEMLKDPISNDLWTMTIFDDDLVL